MEALVKKNKRPNRLVLYVSDTLFKQIMDIRDKTEVPVSLICNQLIKQALQVEKDV